MSLLLAEGVKMNLGKETETLEFKKTTGEMKEAMVSIAAILISTELVLYILG